MYKPAAGTPGADTAAFPCSCFQCSGRPLGLGGWGGHQAGFYNIVLQSYQGFSIESQRFTVSRQAMLALFCFLWGVMIVEFQHEEGHLVFSMIKDSELNSPVEILISLPLRMMTLLLWECSWWGACNVRVTGNSCYIDRKNILGQDCVMTVAVTAE